MKQEEENEEKLGERVKQQLEKVCEGKKEKNKNIRKNGGC